MGEVQTIPTTYDEAVRTLAAWQGEDSLEPIIIYSFPDPNENVVRFVEVSDMFPETGTIDVFSLGQSKEFPFVSSVVLLPTSEWDKVEIGQLRLPPGWELAQKQQVWP